MHLLLKAALRNRRHLSLLITSFVTLILLTMANSLEVSALGVLTNVDTLTQATGGAVSSPMPEAFMRKPKETNPLNWAIHIGGVVAGKFVAGQRHRKLTQSKGQMLSSATASSRRSCRCHSFATAQEQLRATGS